MERSLDDDSSSDVDAKYAGSESVEAAYSWRREAISYHSSIP